MITLYQIEKVKKLIADQIQKEVELGKQSEFMINGTYFPISEYKACGQYIVKEKKQRGIHGTSAAIRVLATNPICDDLTKGMLKYLGNRLQLDVGAQTPNYHWDEKNIIKLSEQLYSISFLGPGRINTENLRNNLVERLQNVYSQRKALNKMGWSYFDDCTKDREILPTAFAVMALNSHEAYCRDEIKYLFTELENSRDFSEPTSFACAVFGLFVLTFKTKKSIKDSLNISDIGLKQIYRKISQSKLCVLDDHIEQNVDYWSVDDEDFNIKVPWQLYFFSLTFHYSSFSFYAPKVQRLLQTIHRSFEDKNEFRYPFAGNYMSVRTISIIFESFASIEENYRESYIYNIRYMVNRAMFFGKYLLGFLATLSCIFAICYSVRYDTKDGILKGIGVGVLQSVLAFVAGFFYKKGK